MNNFSSCPNLNSNTQKFSNCRKNKNTTATLSIRTSKLNYIGLGKLKALPVLSGQNSHMIFLIYKLLKKIVMKILSNIYKGTWKVFLTKVSEFIHPFIGRVARYKH